MKGGGIMTIGGADSAIHDEPMVLIPTTKTSGWSPAHCYSFIRSYPSVLISTNKVAMFILNSMNHSARFILEFYLAMSLFLFVFFVTTWMDANGPKLVQVLV